MHKPLFLITAGSVAAVGALLTATALPAGAATVLAADSATNPTCTVIPPGSAPGTLCTPPADTTTTFTISTTGTLSISAPATAFLGNGVIGQLGLLGATGDFGIVTVADNRAISPAAWTATVSSSDFTNVSGNGTDTIPADDAVYTAGTISETNSTATAVSPGPVTLANPPVSLLVPPIGQTVVTETGADGDNTATWTPTITVDLPGNTVVGTYTGTVEHSVT